VPRLPAGSGENLDAEVASELVWLLLEQAPEFLEKAVLQLLVARGYGGSEGASTWVGPVMAASTSLIIRIAPGSGRDCVQAKRYAPDNVVGRPCKGSSACTTPVRLVAS
jgi:restriction system protein